MRCSSTIGSLQLNGGGQSRLLAKPNYTAAGGPRRMESQHHFPAQEMRNEGGWKQLAAINSDIPVKEITGELCAYSTQRR